MWAHASMPAITCSHAICTCANSKSNIESPEGVLLYMVDLKARGPKNDPFWGHFWTPFWRVPPQVTHTRYNALGFRHIIAKKAKTTQTPPKVGQKGGPKMTPFWTPPISRFYCVVENTLFWVTFWTPFWRVPPIVIHTRYNALRFLHSIAKTAKTAKTPPKWGQKRGPKMTSFFALILRSL